MIMNAFICFCIICITGATVLKDTGKLNLIKIEIFDKSYKKLMVSGNGTLFAPPMVVLDKIKFKNYQCFENIRSNRWSLAIPIIFWNKTYMDMINKSVNTLEFHKKFKTNISEMILPPSGIIAYRLNWKRRFEIFEENILKIDEYWYNSALDYVLSKYHNFIIEFKSSNDSESKCEEFKRKLINETFQIQELVVDFVLKKSKNVFVPSIKISIGNVKLTKMFNDSSCEGKTKCYVSYEYAEKWAYEVSSNILKELNLIHLSLQKEIYENILNNYLCNEKIPIAELETVKKVISQNNEMGCKIPEKVYKNSERVCQTSRIYNRFSNRYDQEEKCSNEVRSYNHEIILQMKQDLVSEENNEFTIPVKQF